MVTIEQVRNGAHVLVLRDVYGGGVRLFHEGQVVLAVPNTHAGGTYFECDFAVQWSPGVEVPVGDLWLLKAGDLEAIDCNA